MIRQRSRKESFGDDKVEMLIKECTEAEMSPKDTRAAIKRITAKALIDAYHIWGRKDKNGNLDVQEVYMCGSGAFNPNVSDYMRAHLVLMLNLQCLMSRA